MAFPRAKRNASENMLNNTSETVTSSISLSSQINFKRNPWEDDNQFSKNSRDALILAEQMNIKTLKNETNCAKAIAELPSSKLITIQREISEKKKEAVKLKQDIAIYKQHKKSGDVLNLDVIEKRINMMKKMCNDVDCVLRNKEKLITRLQTPFVGSFIKVEANYHKYFREVLSDLVPSVINVSPYLDNITWIAHRDLAAGITEPLLVEIQSLMASLQTSYQMLYQMKSGIEELSRNPEEENEANR